MEQRGINPQGLALLAAAAAYLVLRPGVFPGFIDTYISAPLQRGSSKIYGKVRWAGTAVCLPGWVGGGVQGRGICQRIADSCRAGRVAGWRPPTTAH
jgi:hypothetical protein